MTKRRSPIRHSFARQLTRRFPVSLASDERGATAAFVAIGMIMMLGMVALAVDMGMLLGARTDSQRVADSAALAGAASFFTAPNDTDRPRQWAIEYAAMHIVSGTTADVRAEDVDVLLAEKKVRVRVRNIAARSNAIRTIFARVLGWDEVNVGTVAAAQVSPAGRGNCPLPLALPDRWTETDGDDSYIGLPDDLYIPYSETLHGVGGEQCSADPPNVLEGSSGCNFTGFYPGDINDPDEPLIEIKVQSGPADPEDPDYVASPCTDVNSWRCWFQPLAVNGGPGGGGAAELGLWINDCPNHEITIGIGDEIYAASGSGNMQSLVLDEFEELVTLDPDNAIWNDFNPAYEPYDFLTKHGHAYGCATSGGADGPCLNNKNSWRVRFMPIVKTDDVTGTGSGVKAPVIGLACVFVQKVATHIDSLHTRKPRPGQWNVYVRMTDTCIGEGGGDGPILKALQLVE